MIIKAKDAYEKTQKKYDDAAKSYENQKDKQRVDLFNNTILPELENIITSAIEANRISTEFYIFRDALSFICGNDERTISETFEYIINKTKDELDNAGYNYVIKPSTFDHAVFEIDWKTYKEMGEMERAITSRGFDKIEFKDHYGEKCSLQMSSGCTPAVWLGIEDVQPKVCKLGQGWVDVELPKDALCSGRMLLTLDDAKKLIKEMEKMIKKMEE